jgi:hypothetical protein
MRLALVLVLSLVVSGCAIVRKDKEEPVETPAESRSKAGPVLKPSDVLKPDSRAVPSPITDHFSMRVIYFQPSVTTQLRLNSSVNTPGTLLSGEKDLGLDDVLNQGRVSLDMRVVKHHHFRLDFFKSSRFKQGTLQNDINFGDFLFTQGSQFRADLDWRTFTISYDYMPLHTEHFEAGFLHSINIVQARASGGEPGTNNRETASEVVAYPTLGLGGTARITRRFSFNARGQVLYVNRSDGTGRFADLHADLQFRMTPNTSVGLGYTRLQNEFELFDIDQPLLFKMNTNGFEAFFRASF